jgi:hypothetical protein
VVSRGLGRIERAILAVIEREAEEGWGGLMLCAEELAQDIYGPPAFPTRAQVVSVLRAMHSLTRKFPQYALAGGKGREPLWLYDRSDPRSVAAVSDEKAA